MSAHFDIEQAVRASLRIPTARVFIPLLAPKRFKGAKGGRGSGKSRFFASLLIEECVVHPGTRALCVREVQKSLKQSVKALIEGLIVEYGLTHLFEPRYDHILTPGGGRIDFVGMNGQTEQSIKSYEGYRIAWIEEAQTFSQSSLRFLSPTIRTPGSEIWACWNPNSKKDPIDKFFKEAPHDLAICVTANWRDNPWFPEVLYKEMLFDRRRDYEQYLHTWEGHYQSRSSAAVFTNFRYGDPSDFVGLHKVSRRYYGGDFGFSVDPSVLAEMFIQERRLYVSQCAYEVGVEIDHLPFFFAGCDDKYIQSKNPEAYKSLTAAQKKRWTGIENCYEWPITADSARPETISYLKRHGFGRIYPSKKGPGSVNEGIEFLKKYDIIIHPDLHIVHEEFADYSFKVDKKTEEVLPELEDKKNHVIDAARYGVEKLRTATYGVH